MYHDFLVVVRATCRPQGIRRRSGMRRFVWSLGRMWLQRPQGCRCQASDCLHVGLDLYCYLTVTNERAADRPLILIALLVLALALPLVPLSRCKLIGVVLHVLYVLVFIHCVDGATAWIDLIALNVGAGIPRGLGIVVACRAVLARLPMRPHEFHCPASSLADETLDERVTSLLAL